MKLGRNAAVLGLACCIFSSLASANSVPITGGASIGFAQSLGDFNIQGPGISLFQGLPQGPSQIGFCNVGTVCDFSFTLNTSGAIFCAYCLGFSSGTVGNQVADFLVPNLTFTGSAFYSGACCVNVPMTVSGTILGYQLVNCNQFGGGCTLGPVVFRLKISGTTVAEADLLPTGAIIGVFGNFTGTASTAVAPEPISLVLTGTGLIGILIKKRAQQRRTQTL